MGGSEVECCQAAIYDYFPAAVGLVVFHNCAAGRAVNPKITRIKNNKNGI